MYESMNMNMNSRRKKSLGFNNSKETVGKMLKEDNLSPWDKRVFLELMKESSGLEVMEQWLASVVISYPACALTIPCLAVSEWSGMGDAMCPDKTSCPLFGD